MNASRILGIALGFLLGGCGTVSDVREPAADEPAAPQPEAVAQDPAVQEQAPAGRPPGVMEWREQAQDAYGREDYPAFLVAVSRLHELRPHNPQYMYNLVIANALTKNPSAAYATMLRMQQQGLSYDFDQSPDSEFIRGTEVYEYLNDLMKRAGQPAGSATVIHQLPPEVVLPSALAWDPGRKALLVATAREGAVFAIDQEGKAERLLRADGENGMWGIYGVLVDPEGNRLWLSSAANALFAGLDEEDAGRSALFEFSLDNLELLRRYPVPVDGKPHRLGEMVKAPTGEIYVLDEATPVIYRLRPGEARLQPYVASPRPVSMRGIAMSPDGAMLYVAHFETGLMYIEPAAGRAGEVSVPENLNLGGVEGLAWWKDHLVIVQGGIRPQRVMRLELGKGGTSITKVSPLAVAQPFFDHPTECVTVGDDLYFLANSHWEENILDPQRIWVARTGVSEAPNLVPPDIQKFMDEYNASQAAKEAGQKD